MNDWDAAAATFDDEADHGLRDPAVRAAWAALLLADAQTSGGLLLGGEVPGAPVIGEFVPRGEFVVIVR